MKIDLLFILLLITFSCVPVKQQYSDQRDANIREEDKKVVISSNARFQQVLEGTTKERTLTITDYGNIRAGKLIKTYENFSAIDIVGDYLYLPITYGGGCPTYFMCDLIWNTKYESNENGTATVDLVISYNNLDPCRSIIYRTIRYDLKPLRLESKSEIVINLLGYNKRLVYSY